MEGDHTFAKGCTGIFKRHYEGLLIVLPPILFLPVMILNEDISFRCMYLLLVMIVYWITEVIPLGVTSMLPILTFPLMDILNTEKTCQLYFKDTLVMFVTSIMVACSIEYSKLHVRLALRVIQLVGCSPRRLHLGVCLVTSFMSIWIANAACTAMMCPIIFAVLDQLSMQGLVKQYNEEDADLPKIERRSSRIGTCFYLSVAFAASIGGCGSLIGTPTNLALKAIYESRFPNATDEISFGKFMAYSMPGVLVATVAMYVVMEIFFMGLFRPNSADAKNADIGKEGEEVGRSVINEKYADLGPTTIHEITVAVLFTFLIILYIFRKPGFVKGWSEYFEQPSIKNSVPTVGVLLLLFTLPGNYKFFKFWDEQSTEPTPALLTWDFVVPKVPWGLIFLVGGGAVLAEGSKVSGMATKIGNALSVLEVLPPTVLLFTLITAVALITNFSANTAICNITLPVIAEMTVAMEKHPLYMILPVGLGCSIAMMLPVGTPPNAIVQSYANIPTNDMIIGGVLPTLSTIIVFWISAQTWAHVIYPDISVFPSWAMTTENETESSFLNG